MLDIERLDTPPSNSALSILMMGVGVDFTFLSGAAVGAFASLLYSGSESAKTTGSACFGVL
ncbi:MAG: Uncharacterised protein [Flavobacteriaceae bacterium]|nr:MAG: Uncharacterised protein [Flavobacteriaceae bacterium]